MRAGPLGLILLLALACERADPQPLPIPVDYSGLKVELEALRVQLGIPGLSAAVAEGGEVVWEVGLGQAEVQSFRPSTPFVEIVVSWTLKALLLAFTLKHRYPAHVGAAAIQSPS